MKIGEVTRECVVALSLEPELARRLVLKGGTALHLSENLQSRLSTDVDFSTPTQIVRMQKFFRLVEKSLGKHFAKFGYEVIDGAHARKPKSRARALPVFWSGWRYHFKLSSSANRGENPRTKTRRALVPDGAASSKIEIEISEHEYCGSVLDIQIGAATVRVYSSVLLVLEKIRAICQQHPDYLFSQNKNRARDYYDIYLLVKKHRRRQGFFAELKNHLEPVFAAKQVPLDLLEGIFEPEFLELQENGFRVLQDTVGDPLQPFYFYSEQLKWLIGKIRE